MNMTFQTLLTIRKALKKKKTEFIRQDAHKKRKLKVRWNRPRGIDSKIRLHKRGYRKAPSQGYRSPLAVRHLLPDGHKPIMVYSVDDLGNINKETEAGIIGATVGMKKRMAILQSAQQQGIPIANIKNVQAYLGTLESALKDRRSLKDKKKQEKEKKKKDKEKKAEEKEKQEKKQLDQKETIETAISEEEKKEQEKKELDKLLTQKGAQ